MLIQHGTNEFKIYYNSYNFRLSSKYRICQVLIREGTDMKKIAALTTALAVSITMLSTISVSAKNIKVPRAKITKLQSTKPGNLTIKIKKVKKVSGYKVKVSQNKKFKKSKTYKIKKNQKTVKGLKQGKKYFVKVRAYKKIKVKGKSRAVYGKWSKVKSVKESEEKPVKIAEKTKERIKQIENIRYNAFR